MKKTKRKKEGRTSLPGQELARPAAPGRTSFLYLESLLLDHTEGARLRANRGSRSHSGPHRQINRLSVIGTRTPSPESSSNKRPLLSMLIPDHLLLAHLRVEASGRTIRLNEGGSSSNSRGHRPTVLHSRVPRASILLPNSPTTSSNKASTANSSPTNARTSTRETTEEIVQISIAVATRTRKENLAAFTKEVLPWRRIG